MARYWTVQNLLISAAAELGVDPVADVLASTNQVYVQLRYLLDAAGQELVKMSHWEELQKEHAITTDSADTGSYTLPDDFDHMIPQTHWDRTRDNPMEGPRSPQQWQYLLGRDLISSEVYIQFRERNGTFLIYPNDPVPDGLDLRFEYVRNTWVQDADEPTTYKSAVEKIGDTVLFPPILIKKFVKVKFLEAKGFDSEKARDDFATMYDASTGQDGGAPILNAGGRRGYPYLDMWRNTPDTNYGSS